ncbi:MAG: hypothetical protein KatS3mg114_1223 [Planctomycetaceae bacterium]|nr:MAG: hypothetical protein KatS3mg114_1223 [Planctomycetaceae bacterium]
MPSSATEPGWLSEDHWTPDEWALLMTVARRSIEHGWAYQAPLSVCVEDYPHALRQPRGCFVTLKWQGQLRGCTGNLTPSEPLVKQVADQAWRAAFGDPRFSPLTPQEWPALTLTLSILTPLRQLQVQTRDELLSRLQPGITGLVVRAGVHQATFLPSVWEQLRTPAEFVAHLLHKAGVDSSTWSEDWQWWEYRAVSWTAPADEPSAGKEPE